MPEPMTMASKRRAGCAASTTGTAPTPFVGSVCLIRPSPQGERRHALRTPCAPRSSLDVSPAARLGARPRAADPARPLPHREVPRRRARHRSTAHVRGAEAFIVQSLHAPVGEHLLELSLMADVCQREGAASVTAVVPYLGYARHDRRVSGTEPLGARVIAELIAAGRVDRVICLDLHSKAVAGLLPARCTPTRARLRDARARPHRLTRSWWCRPTWARRSAPSRSRARSGSPSRWRTSSGCRVRT